MTRRSRRNYTSGFKTKVALAAIHREQTLGELAQQYDVHPNQIKQWRDQLLSDANDIFGLDKKSSSDEAPIDVKTLHTKIGSAPNFSESLLNASSGICKSNQWLLRKRLIALSLLSHLTVLYG